MNTELEWLKGRYRQELDDLYGNEMKNLNILPQMAEVAQAPALKLAFQYHFETTRAQIGRLIHIFVGLGWWPIHFDYDCLRSLAQEAGFMRPARGTAADSDSKLIVAARKREHREIKAYLMALNCAEILRDQAAASLLEKTLAEEYEADQILTRLSQPDGALLQPEGIVSQASQA